MALVGDIILYMTTAEQHAAKPKRGQQRARAMANGVLEEVHQEVPRPTASKSQVRKNHCDAKYRGRKYMSEGS